MKYTCKQRVFLQLLMRREIPLYELKDPAIGGTDAARQIRFLKAEGVQISWRYKEKGSYTTIYKLEQEPHRAIKERIMNR